MGRRDLRYRSTIEASIVCLLLLGGCSATDVETLFERPIEYEAAGGEYSPEDPPVLDGMSRRSAVIASKHEARRFNHSVLNENNMGKISSFVNETDFDESILIVFVKTDNAKPDTLIEKVVRSGQDVEIHFYEKPGPQLLVLTAEVDVIRIPREALSAESEIVVDFDSAENPPHTERLNMTTHRRGRG